MATLALLRHPSAAMGYIQYGLFGWRFISGQGLPQSHFHELFATPKYVSIDLLPTIGYLTYWDANYAKDVFYLALLGRVLSPKIVFEIGTLQGYTALLFALNTPRDTIIYTLDLPPDDLCSPSLPTTIIDDAHITAHAHSTEYLYRDHPAGTKVRQLYGDSAQFDFTPYHEKVDLFFIDGAHSYEYVRSDSLNALVCTRRGG
ncbi:MAG: class I SAM-dependent methyltransferase [Syntrophaceae bacterium]|nr:class I SAM-dependent methyltransferase [Syntrophaceae bacterium]